MKEYTITIKKTGTGERKLEIYENGELINHIFDRNIENMVEREQFRVIPALRTWGWISKEKSKFILKYPEKTINLEM